MARLRFPGRPGHRFDRLSLKYFADDVKNAQDPSLAFLPQFQRGLKSFRDIVGLSDEEDEFEGFSLDDLEDGEKKLSLFNSKEQKKKTEEAFRSVQPAVEYQESRLGNARQYVESIPKKERLTGKTKTRKSTKDIQNIEYASKSEDIIDTEELPDYPEVAVVKIKGAKLFDHRKKPKKFKLDYKHGLHDMHMPGSKVKKSDMDMAKFLLEKAKQANMLQEQARARRLAASKNAVPVQKKEFVLPTQSSRSSRVIKPNKRFLEDDSVHTIVKKKSKADELTENTPEKQQTKPQNVGRKKSLEAFSPVVSDNPSSVGLLDQPLIVDGKRDRKPSLKLQLSDEDLPLFSPTKSAMTSPLAAPKLGTSLFSQSQFQKASENQKYSMMGFGSSRLHGASIVQKAKLQLNRAALNKSKAALARSLKAEMKREAKFAEQAKWYEGDTGQPVTDSSQKGSEKKTTKKKCCAVCGKKTDLVICYEKIVACLSCRRFYRECNWHIKTGIFIRPTCKTEKCKLLPDRKKCRLCRIKKILEVGFPAIPQLTKLFKDENKRGIKVKTVEPPHIEVENVTSPTVKSIVSPTVKKGVKKAAAVESSLPDLHPTFATPPPSSTEESPSKEQELSPVKAGEGSEKRQRKKRAFKELLRNKQEKSEVEEPEQILQEKPVVQEPPPVVATGSVEISPRGGPGPRIKHVCRNAAVVLGQPLATFPEKSELRLSALPTKDKVQLWKKDEETKAANIESDDDRPMEEIIQQSGDNVVIVKKSPAKSYKAGKKLTGAGGLHIYKRKMRCRKCQGCTRLDCGKCRHCLDMKKFGGPGTIKKACVDKPKFGGPGVLKQGCVERRCSNPLIQRSATEAFIVEKKKNPADSRARVMDGNPDVESAEQEMDVADSPGEFGGLEPVIPGSEVTPTVSGLVTQTGTLLEVEAQSADNVPEKQTENVSAGDDKAAPDQEKNLSQGLETRQKVASRSQGTEVRKLSFEDLPNFRLERISSRNKEAGKISSKLMKKFDMQQKYSKREGGNDGQCYPVTLQSVLPASRQWGSLLSQPKYHPIKVDFKGKHDINSAWNYGMALTMSAAMSVRTLCFLCGSAGKHEMIYCNICCEPFHEFCLEDWEQPAPDHYNDWICAACQFCNVCGRQNNLLQCDKCQNTYHPGCLGPNYPTKPSKRKKIWICTKCVKCKSCGATTPGSHSQATWTYDFSLCFECGRLMDKGNFCPICRKCYSDDDWESKMIQCNKCESWVHSKCEGLTDEMYEILSYLPEDLSFYCRKCFPVGCPEWERTLKHELRMGLENILQALILSKSSQFILKYERRKSSPMNALEPCDKLQKENLPSNTCAIIDSVGLVQDKLEKSPQKYEKIKQLLQGSGELTESPTSESRISVEDSQILKPNIQNQVTFDRNCLENNNVLQQCVSVDERFNDVLMSSAVPVSMETGDLVNDSAAAHTSGKDAEMKAASSEKTVETKNVIPKTKDNSDKTKHSCDSNERIVSESSEVAHELEQCTDRQVENKTLVCDTENESPNDSSTVQVSNEENKSEYISSNKSGDEVMNQSEKCHLSSGESLNLLKTDRTYEIESVSEKVTDVGDERAKTDEKAEILTSMDGKCVNKVHKSTESSESMDVDSSHVSESNFVGPVTQVSSVVPKRTQHVHFSLAENKETKELVKAVENSYPRDLLEIAEKMKTGDYKSVAVFCEDILRVIQTYLDDEEETRTSRKKATQSAKSIFVKQLEKIFPWFNVKTCRHWYSRSSLPDGMLADATLPPSTDHTYAQWLERIEPPRSPQPSPFKKRIATPVKKYMPIDDEDYDIGQLFEGDDERKCMFCHTFGDQDANDAGRLLYCGQDDWCHVNCALWSAEVYEDADGELQDIVEAFSRGKMLKCDLCGKTGATVGCHTKGCKSNYHFMCARKDQCRFQEDKKVFCWIHRMLIDGELMQPDRYSVLRRTFVGALNVRSVKKHWAKGVHCADISVLIGSCCVESLGRLTDLSDKPKYLQPVDFITTRMYWSTKDARRRCVYTCRIVEVRPEALKSPTVTIKDMRIVHDPTHPDFVRLSALDLTGINCVIEEQHISICDKESFVDLTADSVALSETLSADENTMETSCERSQLSDLTLNKRNDTKTSKTFKNSQRRASFSGLTSDNIVSKESDRLSTSWPRSNSKSTTETPLQADLSFLSPKTLKMLNIKDPSKFMKPVQNIDSDQDDFSLLKVADRLNRAAANSSRRTSEERSSPLLPRSAGNSPLPFRCQSRSPSVERGSVNQQNNFSSLLASLPEKPFSPPARMLSRSKSLSVEKESLLAKSSSENKTVTSNDPFLPSQLPDSPHFIRRGRAVSDPSDLTLKPVSCSSPVASKTDKADTVSAKLVLSDISTDNETSADLNRSAVSLDDKLTESEQETMETENMDTEQDEITATESLTSDVAEISGMDTSQNTEEIADDTTETIVVMTENGESLSEEDAIKIVQEIIEKQNSSCETEECKNDPIEDVQTKQCSKNEDANSPFIPQIEAENTNKDERVRRNTGDKNGTEDDSQDSAGHIENTENSSSVPESHAETTNNMGESFNLETGDVHSDNTEKDETKVILIGACSDSDSGDDITDITDSVVKSACHVNAENNTVKLSSDENSLDSNKAEGAMKRIVYDLDESIDSDIELLDDLNGVEEDDECQISSENDNAANKSSVDGSKEIRDTEEITSADSDTTELVVGKRVLPELSDQSEITRKLSSASVKEDEIDGESSKNVKNEYKQMSESQRECLGDMIEDSETVSIFIEEPVIKNSECILKTDNDESKKMISNNTETSSRKSKQTFSQVDRETNVGEQDSSKEDVLRGLGLGTLDEVEKIKNSPRKSPSIPVLTPQKSPTFPIISQDVKRKCPKLSPIKSYPLRRNKVLAANVEDGTPGSCSHRNGNELVNTSDLKEFENGLCKEMSPELPVLDPLAKKIKEESIAKSCPEEKGPFKCSKCRRLYRTETSYLVHVENCDFLVSSSDDEDVNEVEEGGEDGTVNRTSKIRRSIRSRKKSLNTNKVENTDHACNSDDNSEVNKRASLRRSTQFQRVALEVAEKRQMEGESTKRGRGRPPWKSKDSVETEKDYNQRESVSVESFPGQADVLQSSENADISVKRGRGRPRKSEITCKNTDGEVEYMEIADEKMSVRDMRRKSREAKVSENVHVSSDSDVDERENQKTLLKRRRGRPKKIDCDNEYDNEPCTTKRKLRICGEDTDEICSVKENSFYMTEMEDNVQDEKDKLKSQVEKIRNLRFRARKMMYIKKRNKTLRKYVKDSKRPKCNNNKFGLHSVSVSLKKVDFTNKEDTSFDDRKLRSGIFSEANDKKTSSSDRGTSETGKVRSRSFSPPGKAMPEHQHDSERSSRFVTRKHEADFPNLRKRRCSQSNLSIKETGKNATRKHHPQFDETITSAELGAKRRRGRPSLKGKKEKDGDVKREENTIRKISSEDQYTENRSENELLDMQESSGEEDSILDETTGWIVDKKTGEMVWSPTVKKTTKDESEESINEDEQASNELVENINEESDPNELTENACSGTTCIQSDAKLNVKDLTEENQQVNEIALEVKQSECINKGFKQNEDSEMATEDNTVKEKLKENAVKPDSDAATGKIENISATVLNVNSDCGIAQSVESGSATELNVNSDCGIVQSVESRSATEINVNLDCGIVQSVESGSATELNVNSDFGIVQSVKSGSASKLNVNSDCGIVQSVESESKQNSQLDEENNAANSKIDCSSKAEVRVTSERGAIQSMELKDSDSLPQTVLKLLKDGHKVVIKNPKLNKCFMWQKTADGYIGKPFDKEIAKRKSQGQKKEISIPCVDKPNSIAPSTPDSTVESRFSKSSQQTASDILKERKRFEMEQEQGIPGTVISTCSQNLLEKSEVLKQRKAKFVLENIERLIENNKKAKAKAMITTQLPAGSAEYVGGIIISPPKSVTMDEVKQTIKSTAPIASSMLQNTFLQKQMQNNFEISAQSMQNNLSSSVVSSSVQTTIPSVTPSSYPTLQQQLQAGSMRMLTETDLAVSQTALQTFPQVSLQNLVQTGYSNISVTGLQSLTPVGQQYSPQVVQQTYQQVPVQQISMQQVSQIPFDLGMMNIPVMSSVGLSGSQLVQPGLSGSQLVQPGLSSSQFMQPGLSGSQLVQSFTALNSSSSQALMNTNMSQTFINRLTQPVYGVNPPIQQSLANAQFASQPLLSPQSQSQASLSPVNLLSTSPQTSHVMVNQLVSLPRTSQTVSNTCTLTSQQNTYETALTVKESHQPSFSCPQPVYNQTQIVNKLSIPTVVDQRLMSDNSCIVALKQKLTNKSQTIFTVKPGLGGGSTSLIKKMENYLASTAKSQQGSPTSPPYRTIKPNTGTTEESNGVVKNKSFGSLIQKVIYPRYAPDTQLGKKQVSVTTSKIKGKVEKSPKKWIKGHPKKKKVSSKIVHPSKISSRIALPHKTDKASHPMIHGQKEVTSLPVAAVEEEVRDVPLSALDDGDGRQTGCPGLNLGHLEYEITSDDGFTCRSDSLDGAWKQVTEKVQDARTASRLKNLSYAGLSGLQMFGLSHPNVVYLVEQLYGASYCRRYKFKYHSHEMVERELELVNPTGCIRTEPYSGRNPTDMFSFLMSRYRKLPEYSTRVIDEEIAMKSSRRATSMDLPMAMRFRKLKGFSKECVGVYRSPIHGRGLFCKRNIDAGEMIIEYAGEVIRNSMTDTREKYYESKGIGCYMFRIDDTDVVDATMKGSAARFINHSCDPNCYSKVITVDNRKHIVIFAMRKILRGEELTYDYKFPIEEIKIPCTCGAKRCRRYLN